MSTLRKKVRGVIQVNKGLMELAGNRQEQVIHGIKAVNNLKTAIRASKAGRTADRDNALGQFKESAKNFIIQSHPLTRTIEAGKRIVEGIRDIFNHKEWYMHGTNIALDKLIGMNFARRMDVRESVYTSMGLTGLTFNNSTNPRTNYVGQLSIGLTVPKDDKNTFFQAIAILYSKIRAANAGSINYTPADLAAYVLNVRSIRASLEFLKKVVGISNFVNAYDSNLPAKLVEAATLPEKSGTTYYGINFQTIISNKAKIVNFINAWIKQVKNLLPLNLDLLARTDWLVGSVFRDSNDVKSNYYVTVLQDAPIYTNNSGTLSNASSINIWNSGTSFEANLNTCLNSITQAVNLITTNTTNSIIAGDILRLQGDSAFYNTEFISVETVYSPIFDEAALTQVQNASMISALRPNTKPTTVHTINFNTQSITETYTISSSDYIDTLTQLGPQARYINMYKDSIEVGDIMSATRLTAFAGYSTTATSKISTLTHCGTEVVLGFAVIWNFNTTDQYYTSFRIGAAAPGDGINAQMVPSVWSVLDYAPMIVFTPCEYNSTSFNFGVLFDFNNYALAAISDIDTLHQYCALSLLAITDKVSRKTEFTYRE